jgi:hypothetical protein
MSCRIESYKYVTFPARVRIPGVKVEVVAPLSVCLCGRARSLARLVQMAVVVPYAGSRKRGAY